MFTIGTMARQTGVKIPTIRYYEQMGLISEPERSSGNQRRYRPIDRDRLTFVKHARDLGFTIEAIRELLALSAHPESPCIGAHEIAARQLQQVKEKMLRLKQLGEELSRMSDACHVDQIKNCSLLQSLLHEEPSDGAAREDAMSDDEIPARGHQHAHPAFV